MRASTSASHACGSTSFIFAVTMRLYRLAAARRRDRSRRTATTFFQGDSPQGALGGVVAEANATVVRKRVKASQRLSM